MEERPPIWMLAVDILNKQTRTSENGGPPARGLSQLITTPHCKNVSRHELFMVKLRIETDGGHF
jgi:hypothetical protein